MRRIGFQSLVGVIVLALTLLLRPVAAQEGTPPPEGDEEELAARIILPEECVVEPRSAEELFPLLGLDGNPPPEIEVIPVQLPFTGDQVDLETQAAIIDLVRQWFACLNASDELRVAALMTDAGAQAYFGARDRTPEEIETAKAFLTAPPEPRQVPETEDTDLVDEDLYIRLISVTDATFLEDGRVVAFVVMNEPLTQPRGPETLLVVFSRADENSPWKIDGFLDFAIVTPTQVPEGTPEASVDQSA
jgi:hypothetical protein